MTPAGERLPSRWRPAAADVAAALAAYRHGAFPMAMSPAEPASEGLHPDYEWYVADPRAVLPLDGMRVSRSLRRRVRSQRFTVTGDHAFDRVVLACQQVPRKPPPGSPETEAGTWISDDYRALLGALHRRGLAHSLEAWLPGGDGDEAGDEAVGGEAGDGEVGGAARLVGGIYGVAVGGVFCAESMFTLPERGGSDAGKVCLTHLVAHLRERGFALLDAQILNPFTRRLGAVEMALDDYLALLRDQHHRRIDWCGERIEKRSGEEVLADLAEEQDEEEAAGELGDDEEEDGPLQ